MKTRCQHSQRRLIAAASAIVVFVITTLAVLLLAPPAARANASPAGQAKTLLTPPPPPPINPPLQTPEPGQGGAAQSSGGYSDPRLKAIPFQPKEVVIRGKPDAGAQSAEKPQGAVAAGQGVGPQSAYVAPDYSGLVGAQGWNLLGYEGFEGVWPPAPSGNPYWDVFDNDVPASLNGEYYWNDVNTLPQVGFWSAWPAAGGANALSPSQGYANNMQSWMVYGPFDFTGMTDVFVGFGLWYDTELNFDFIKFCTSTDGNLFYCDQWSGWSNGWTDQAFWLTSYAGYSQLWFAWIFRSDATVSGDFFYMGAYVDQIVVWADDSPPVTATPDPNGQMIRNGGFEDSPNHLNYWNTVSAGSLEASAAPGQRPALSVSSSTGDGDVGVSEVNPTTISSVEGQYSVYLWTDPIGNDFLYQTFPISASLNSMVIDYWFALPTFETFPVADFFCASLRDGGGNPISNPLLVDLGCLDAVNAAGYWQESIYTLTASEIAAVASHPTLALVFEMYNTGNRSLSSTALYVDYVRVYVTGGAAASLDPNEPNNTTALATTLACNTTESGVVGDALGGYDIDFFRLNSVQPGVLQLDIDARTKVQDPRSTLDSVVRLYNNSGVQLAVNDDDGVTFDSFISYTVTSADTYYASVESFTGSGGPNAYYDLTANCNASGGQPGGGGGASEPPADTWTVMLYLNAEDPNFESLLTQYRLDIEAFIGSKSSFLKVVILYDGSGNGDTVRYVVQPNGNYTLNVNKWNLGELNLGDPETLANFIYWATTQFPAENYYLAIDDHGNGTSGVSWDTQPNPLNQPQLTPPEIYSAIKDGTGNGARKLDIVDFEACLMGLAENAYDMRQWADYVIFSQQISWGINTYPVYFSDLAATDAPLLVGQRIVDRYSAVATSEGRPHTISLVDASQMLALRAAVTNFANALVASGNPTPINQARTASQVFAPDREATNPAYADYVDLWDFAAQVGVRGIAVSQAAAVQNAVDAAVVHERHVSGGLTSGPSTYVWDHSRAHGISIYYPSSRTSSNFQDYIGEMLYQMTQVDGTGQEGTWDEFLNWVMPASGARGNGRGMGASRAEFKLSASTTSFVTLKLYLPFIRK